MPYTVQYETPDTATSRGGGRRIKTAAAIAAAVTLAAGAYVAAGHRDGPTSSPPPAGAASAQPGDPGASATQPATGGLPRGKAVAGGGGRKTIAGVPVGYERNATGAVEAATAYTAAQLSPAIYVAESRHAILDYIYAADTDAKVPTDESVAAVAARMQINGTGQPINSDGTLNQQLRLFGNCYGEYGAYNVLASTDSAAKLHIWMPCTFGAASADDTSQLKTAWMLATVDLTWDAGDWRIQQQRIDTGASSAVTPTWQTMNTPLASRPRLLATGPAASPAGHGWMLYADATDAPLAYLGAEAP